MSMYSTLELQLQPNRSLTNSDIENIKKIILPICGINDFADISITSIHFCATYNYGLDKIKKLMAVIEQYIDYAEPVQIGKLTTEEIWNYEYASVFAYKNKLMAITIKDQGVFNFFCEEITINNLRGKSIQKFNKDDKNEIFLEEMIKEFIRD